MFVFSNPILRTDYISLILLLHSRNKSCLKGRAGKSVRDSVRKAKEGSVRSVRKMTEKRDSGQMEKKQKANRKTDAQEADSLHIERTGWKEQERKTDRMKYTDIRKTNKQEPKHFLSQYPLVILCSKIVGALVK